MYLQTARIRVWDTQRFDRAPRHAEVDGAPLR